MSGTNFSSAAFTGKFNYAGASGAGGADGARANFDARRPVAITIGMTNPLLPPPGGGHAIVGDGYGRIDGRWYYHFNMGWGGSGNLWYNVEEYYLDSVAGGTEWGGMGASVGNVYRKSMQPNENTASGKIISGRITDAAGNPVPGVQVKLQQGAADFLRMMVWNDTDRDYTDENGIWAVDKVPDGAYDIVMTKAGLAFSGPKEVTVAWANQRGLNFIATADTAADELVLDAWYYDFDNFMAGAGLLILEFNRPIGEVAVDPTALAVNGGALTGGVIFQAAGSPLVVIVLNAVDTATIQGLGVALTLDMPRNFLEADVDGEGSQAGQHDAATIPVAPLVSAQAEAAGLPIDPATPQVSSTQLLVDGAALPGTANPYATSAGTVQFLVTFSEAVQGVDADDFGLRLTKNFVNTSPWPFEEYAAKPDTPLPSAVITAVAPTDGAGTPTASPSATWTVTVSMGNGDGYVRLDVIDNDTIMDVANAEELGGMGAHNGDFFYSEFAYRFDNHGPVIVSASLAADNTYVDLTWNEPVGSTDSLAKTSSFSDLVPQYRWFNTNGAGGQQAGDALWLDRGVAQDNDFFRREDVVLMEPPFTTGLLDGTDRTGEFKNLQANVPVLGATTVAHVCYIELDGELGCSAGDGLFLDVGEVVGLGINFDETFTPGSDMWFWPSGAEPSVATLGAQVPDRTSYYAENAAIPVPDVDDLEAEFQTWVTGFLAGNNNGIWLDYSPADSIYTVGDITDGFVDEMVTGTEPADGQVGASAMPATAMYRDANSNGLLDGADLIWLDDGSTANAYDSGDTRLDDNGDPLPGVLNANALRVLLTKNGGTVTSVGISSITDVAGDALTEGASVTRCHLNYTPDLDLAGGAAPTYLNEYRVPAGVETIEIVPVEENVFDSLGNPADTQTTSGEMRLHDSSIPRVVDIILADDNYSAKVVFSERVYTNGNGISNHNPESVGDNVGDLTVDDFTAATNTNAININNISYSLANNYCILYFGNNAASRALVDPAATGATTLTVSIAAGDIFDFGGNAVPATDWDVTLRAPYDIDDPDSMPPRYFTTGDGAYLRYGTAPVETNTDTDAEGLTYNGIFYRDLDGDCRVDAVDLNFRNPYPNQTYTPALSTGGTFRVWVQNNDPEDTSNAPEDENLANVSDTNFTGGLPSRASSDWSEITVQSMSVYRVTTYYSTIRVLINQSQVRARTHGKRWVMISYNDSTDGTDGLPPASGETDTRERDGVHWYRQIVQNPDVADYYYVVGDFPPTMAWDGAPARPISAAMWRTTNYNKSGESSSYNSYDYLDIVFSEPLSSVGNTGWTPGASYGAGSSVHQKEGPYGPEIIDLLSGTAQTVRLWFNSTSVRNTSSAHPGTFSINSTTCLRRSSASSRE